MFQILTDFRNSFTSYISAVVFSSVVNFKNTTYLRSGICHEILSALDGLSFVGRLCTSTAFTCWTL